MFIPYGQNRIINNFLTIVVLTCAALDLVVVTMFPPTVVWLSWIGLIFCCLWLGSCSYWVHQFWTWLRSDDTPPNTQDNSNEQ